MPTGINVKSWFTAKIYAFSKSVVSSTIRFRFFSGKPFIWSVGIAVFSSRRHPPFMQSESKCLRQILWRFCTRIGSRASSLGSLHIFNHCLNLVESVYKYFIIEVFFLNGTPRGYVILTNLFPDVGTNDMWFLLTDSVPSSDTQLYSTTYFILNFIDNLWMNITFIWYFSIFSSWMIDESWTFTNLISWTAQCTDDCLLLCCLIFCFVKWQKLSVDELCITTVWIAVSVSRWLIIMGNSIGWNRNDFKLI